MVYHLDYLWFFQYLSHMQDSFICMCFIIDLKWNWIYFGFILWRLVICKMFRISWINTNFFVSHPWGNELCNKIVMKGIDMLFIHPPLLSEIEFGHFYCILFLVHCLGKWVLKSFGIFFCSVSIKFITRFMYVNQRIFLLVIIFLYVVTID